MTGAEDYNRLQNEAILRIINAQVEFILVCDSLGIKNIENNES